MTLDEFDAQLLAIFGAWNPRETSAVAHRATLLGKIRALASSPMGMEAGSPRRIQLEHLERLLCPHDRDADSPQAHWPTSADAFALSVDVQRAIVAINPTAIASPTDDADPAGATPAPGLPT